MVDSGNMQPEHNYQILLILYLLLWNNMPKKKACLLSLDNTLNVSFILVNSKHEPYIWSIKRAGKQQKERAPK